MQRHSYIHTHSIVKDQKVAPLARFPQKRTEQKLALRGPTPSTLAGWGLTRVLLPQRQRSSLERR